MVAKPHEGQLAGTVQTKQSTQNQNENPLKDRYTSEELSDTHQTIEEPCKLKTKIALERHLNRFTYTTHETP